MDFSRAFPYWESLDCPYGKPGDQLWVRETWNLFDQSGNSWPKGNRLPKECPEGWHVIYYQDAPVDVQKIFSFRPSIHMTRWASRIQLEITDVRVERVNEITHGDCFSEGHPTDWSRSQDQSIHMDAAKDWFMDLWDSINKSRGYGWEENPYVWVVEFQRKEAA